VCEEKKSKAWYSRSQPRALCTHRRGGEPWPKPCPPPRPPPWPFTARPAGPRWRWTMRAATARPHARRYRSLLVPTHSSPHMRALTSHRRHRLWTTPSSYWTRAGGVEVKVRVGWCVCLRGVGA
jgi:hypothetical protein